MHLSVSKGFGGGSVSGGSLMSDSFGGGIDTSVGSFRASSKANSLDSGGVSRRLASEEFNSGSMFKESFPESPSSDFYSPYGMLVTSSEPSGSLKGFGAPSLQIPQKYGAPSQSYNLPTESFTQYEAPEELSQNYEMPSRPLATYDGPAQLYGVPAPHPSYNNGLPLAGFLSIEEFDSDNGLDGDSNSLLIVSNKLSSGNEVSGNYHNGGRYSRDYSAQENIGNTFVDTFSPVTREEYFRSLQKYEEFFGGQRYSSDGGYLY